MADKNNCKNLRNRVRNLVGHSKGHRDSNNVHPGNSNSVRNNKDHRGNSQDHMVSSKSHLVNSRRDRRISSSHQSPGSKEGTSQEIPNSAKGREAIRKKTDTSYDCQ